MIGIDLAGRRAVVTGASAGIGRASAEMLARAGANVVAVARRVDALAELSEAHPERITPLIADVTHPDAAERISRSVEGVGGVDILVNAAGGSRTVALDSPESAWHEAMELNFDSLRRLTHALLPLLTRSGHGRIICVTGSSEPAPNPVFASPGAVSSLNAANSAKAAVHAWAKGLSREVGRLGVTVNSVAPGTVRTAQIRRILPTEADEQQHVADLAIPLGRLGEPEEVAALIAFLASDHGSYVTGEIINVDGGKRRFAF
ncbi:SDR family NAD(P)-dependent oxidoreductase [Microbacterium sp. NPDC091313]